MTRLNIEDHAFCDPRLSKLAREIRKGGFDLDDLSEFAAIGCLAILWHETQAELQIFITKEECDLFLDLELISGLIEEFRDRFKTIDKEVRIRIMIKNVENDNEISNIVKKIRPEHKDFMVKIINNSESIPYYIIDQRELWIGMKNRTEVGLPCVLWTNERNIIKFFQDSFNEAWNCPKALIVFQSKT